MERNTEARVWADRYMRYLRVLPCYQGTQRRAPVSMRDFRGRWYGWAVAVRRRYMEDLCRGRLSAPGCYLATCFGQYLGIVVDAQALEKNFKFCFRSKQDRELRNVKVTFSAYEEIPKGGSMPFPSKDISAWCQQIRSLWERTSGSGRGYSDFGWCQCESKKVIEIAPADHRAQLISGLFWSVWIDQVLFTVAPGHVYAAFRDAYPFPKLYSHLSGGHVAPWFLLSDALPFPMPDKALLLEDKREFWGEVTAFLESIESRELVRVAEQEFRNDLDERQAPAMVRALWE